MKVKTLPALDGVRVLATMGIFLFHSGFLLNGTFPVTLFFMLSGFMMYYTKRDDIHPMTGIMKMRKMYPLHLLTFLISIIVWQPWRKYTLSFLLKAGILHLTLLQAWFPKYTFTYNGLAWYLSITLFLYVISYPLILLTRRIKKPLPAILLLLVIITAINWYGGGVDSGLYTNPIYRILDFLLGMVIAKYYLDNDNLTEKSASFLELALIPWFLVQYGVSFVLGYTPGYYSALFTVLLYVFAVGKGCISKILSLPLFHRLAKYSFEFYMIHELALRVFRKVFSDETIFYPIRCTLIAVPALICSIVFVFIYRNIITLKKGRLRCEQVGFNNYSAL